VSPTLEAHAAAMRQANRRWPPASFFRAGPPVSRLHRDGPRLDAVDVAGRPPVRELQRVRDLLLWLWKQEACWICGRLGGCGHREIEVDIARLSGWASLLKAHGKETDEHRT